MQSDGSWPLVYAETMQRESLNSLDRDIFVRASCPNCQEMAARLKDIEAAYKEAENGLIRVGQRLVSLNSAADKLERENAASARKRARKERILVLRWTKTLLEVLEKTLYSIEESLSTDADEG